MFIYCDVWLTYGFQHLIPECLKKLAKIDNKEKALLVKVLWLMMSSDNNDDVFVMMKTKTKQHNSIDLSSEHKSSFDFPK